MPSGWWHMPSIFKFLGTLISNNLLYNRFNKSHWCFHFLRFLKLNCLGLKLLVAFYCSTVASIPVQHGTAWYAGCSVAEKKTFQRVINTAQKIIGCALPSLEEIANSGCLSRTLKITPAVTHCLTCLPSSRHNRSLKTRTNRIKTVSKCNFCAK